MAITFDPPLVTGILHKRYKRFLADIRLDSGEEITAHVANTGSMKGCAEPGSRVALSHHPDAKRKYAYSWELVEVNGHWVCINTARANRIVENAILDGTIEELANYPKLRREVAYAEKSRVDFLLEGKGPPCWVEVKNVTLADGKEAIFPDAVTTRGTRHLEDLMAQKQAGDRAVMLFLINRPDPTSFRAAHEIDPTYAETLIRAQAAGVEVLTYATTPTLTGISVPGSRERIRSREPGTGEGVPES